MKLLCELEYASVPTFIEIGVKKKKKVYLSYNAIYSGAHHTVRKKIVDVLKLFMASSIKKIPNLTTKITISLEYKSKRKQFDIDNKCGLFCKVFLDMIKGVKIKDDNVQFVNGIMYHYTPTDSIDDTLIIKIYESN